MNDLDDLLEDIPDTKATKKQVSKNIIPSKTKPKIQPGVIRSTVSK